MLYTLVFISLGEKINSFSIGIELTLNLLKFTRIYKWLNLKLYINPNKLEDEEILTQYTYYYLISKSIKKLFKKHKE